MTLHHSTATTAESSATGIDPIGGGRQATPENRWWQRPFWLRLAAGLIILAIWQFVVGSFAADYVARPLGVISVIPEVISDGGFWAGAQSTLVAVLLGLAIAVVFGSVLGLVVGRLPDVQRVLGMYVNGLYALPIVAIVPLLTVWFGYTEKARLVVIVIEAILPVIYNVAEGARNVASTFVDVARVNRAPWWRQWFGVALPASLPYVLAGIDLAIGRALVGAVVAEFVTSVPGLGYYILFNVNSFHENQAVVALLLLATVAILFRFLTNATVARLMPWYRAGEQGKP